MLVTCYVVREEVEDAYSSCGAALRSTFRASDSNLHSLQILLGEAFQQGRAGHHSVNSDNSPDVFMSISFQE